MPPVTEVCMGCICEASSNCNQTLRCNGDVCGLFRITWAYWSDAGKPTQANEGPDSETGKRKMLMIFLDMMMIYISVSDSFTDIF